VNKNREKLLSDVFKRFIFVDCFFSICVSVSISRTARDDIFWWRKVVLRFIKDHFSAAHILYKHSVQYEACFLAFTFLVSRVCTLVSGWNSRFRSQIAKAHSGLIQANFGEFILKPKLCRAQKEWKLTVLPKFVIVKFYVNTLVEFPIKGMRSLNNLVAKRISHKRNGNYQLSLLGLKEVGPIIGQR